MAKRKTFFEMALRCHVYDVAASKVKLRPLRDDGLLYAEHLQAAGVNAVLYPGHGLFHGCLRARSEVEEVDLLYCCLLAYPGSELLTQV